MDTLRAFDPFALAASVIALLMIWAYVAVIHSQGDQPLVWVVAVLAIGACLAAYGSARNMAYRPIALGAAAGLLGLLGLLAIFSIGLGILVAAGLAMVAFVRAMMASSPSHRGDRVG